VPAGNPAIATAPSAIAGEKLARGLVGFAGPGPLIPEGVALATFLAAFAYSGAGGNLNLTQSIYVKEKGYGMAAYAEKLAGLFTAKGASARIRLAGQTFEDTPEARDAIFAAAASVIGEHGYVGATIKRITEQAGIAQGTFYLYFDSRQALFEYGAFVATTFVLIHQEFKNVITDWYVAAYGGFWIIKGLARVWRGAPTEPEKEEKP